MLPFCTKAQDITGLWTGTLFNDTTKQELLYEVAITSQKGKLSGYSMTTFVIDGKAATGVKSLKVVPQEDRFFLEDVELLMNNYPVAPPKGVKQISSVTYTVNGEAAYLSGKFITTRARQYGRQVTGTIKLKKSLTVNNDKLLAALDQLGLSASLSFLPTVATANDKQSKLPLGTDATAPKVAPVPPKPASIPELLAKRKVQTIETVWIDADSIQLQLYDNGYVDGDSVSVVVNGSVVLAHQRLSTQAISKTIAATGDSLKVVMFAENLGSIAPNTGLLIIYDGSQRHEIRFEGDLETNAAIMLKKRRKPLGK